MRFKTIAALSGRSTFIRSTQILFFTLAVLAFVPAAYACGPYFPNMMLVGGDEPLFTAPVARFCDEMQRVCTRLKIAAPVHTILAQGDDQRASTAEIDLADLALCLRGRGAESNEIARIVREYRSAREKLNEYTAQREAAANRYSWFQSGNADEPKAPEAPSITPPAGLPAEFAQYLRGAVAWHTGDTNAARNAWLALLEMPFAERRYKSAWAAFMIARSYDGNDPGKAISHYSLVRALAAEGAHDSPGLAAASVGWQARAHLQQKEYEAAISGYLSQLAAGDDTAYVSLRVAAQRALEDKDRLPTLARHAPSRAVITAHIISSERSSWSRDDNAGREALWLAAIEKANVSDIESAERLALAAYQLGDFDTAQRWIRRSINAPVSRWLQAKLHLRNGKVPEAARLLAALTQIFPLAEPTNSAHLALADNLYVPASEDTWTAGQRVLGELGVLRLHRREYAQALDALLRAGFLADAAYVGERVLTLDELKDYVDSHWPADAHGTEDDGLPQHLAVSRLAAEIRYILARRLTRADRTTEARVYYPEERLAAFDQLVLHLVSAQNVSLSNEERATNYYHAAWIVRTNGMELMGTELEPDFTIWAGNFEAGPTIQSRAEMSTQSVARASSDELKRARAHEADPPQRWHYRGHAAALAYEAAKLLPNNTDATARALYWAGRWVENADTSDFFYKSLVRRCRKTALGAAADEWRWFPRLDENGEPRPAPRRAPPVAPQVVDEVTAEE